MSGRQIRLGVLGGTFDPIHHGHLILASELRASLGLDTVLLVPNAQSPFKNGDDVSPASDRLAMLRLAVADTPWLEISSAEIDRGGVSFTIDTLADLHTIHPDAKLVFLMGADSLADLPRWRDPAGIVTLAEIGVASRPGSAVDLEPLLAALPSARDRIALVSTPHIAISATDIRGRVRAGRPISFHVPLAVEHHIHAHRLYRN